LDAELSSDFAFFVLAMFQTPGAHSRALGPGSKKHRTGQARFCLYRAAFFRKMSPL
jgi:hypothetical protein